ncbi:protein terminal ear1-like [Melia azedarach]|uniref:Protein terminal ear1-like n=1 Tax=Melia azedarach TaxID=155640 RepID=A0ACC1XZP5_MELAZ|nr:protein terminal ear1-like [Melia azedarach]
MAEAKLQKSLNPEAPEFLPKRSQIPSFHDYQNQNPPSPYIQTYTMPVFPRSFYPNPYSIEPVLQHHDFQSPLPTASFTEPAAPLLMVGEQPYAAAVAVQKGDRGVARRGCRNRFFDQRSNQGRRGFKGRDNQANNKPEWRPKFNNRDYLWFRNLQHRATPPQHKHPVLSVSKDGGKTTVMIRNIPNRYSREMLMNFLDDHCMVENRKQEVQDSGASQEKPAVSAYDFLYLPIDFKNRVNKGYAFVNFTEPSAVWKFYLASHNMRWNAFQSNKICEIAYARLQGKEELVNHFQSVDFPCDQGKEEYLPVCFSPERDGSREKVNQHTVGRITSSRIWDTSTSSVKPRVKRFGGL